MPEMFIFIQTPTPTRGAVSRFVSDEFTCYKFIHWTVGQIYFIGLRVI